MRINLDQSVWVHVPPKKGNFAGLVLPCVVFPEQPVQFKRKLPLPRCLLYFRDSTLRIMLLLQPFTSQGPKVSGPLLVC